MLGIWNNIDVAALYFGLDRLQGESNEDFLERLKQISKYKYKTDYYSLSHNIPIQLGLKTEVIGRIRNTRGNIFDCKIDWDYFTLNEILPDFSIGECIRIFIGSKNCTIQKIKDTLALSTYFTLDVYDSANLDLSVDYLIRNRSIKSEIELINTQHQKLLHENLVPKSFIIDSTSFRNLKASPTDCIHPGDYFIENKIGYSYCSDYTVQASKAQYRYFDTTFALERTDINLIPVKHFFKYGYSNKSLELILDLMQNNIAGI